MATEVGQSAVEVRPSRRGRWELAGFRLVRSALRAIPHSLALSLGASIGALLCRIDRSRRRVGLRNLEMAFPELGAAERRRILLDSCRQIGRMGAEICHFPNLTPENIHRFVTVENPERWQHALDEAAEHGGIVLTGHFGNWELLAYAAGLMGHPVTLIYKPMKNRLVNREIDEMRRRAGTRSLAKRSAAKEALRSLRKREMVVIAADQNQARDYGVFVDLFGIPACTTTGPVRLAMLTGAPIYPVFMVREGASERHRIVVLPRVELQRSGDRHADMIVATQRCSDVLEAMIRRHPDHWVWFHKRWNTRPEGEPSLYG